jgi:hypothetical protein
MSSTSSQSLVRGAGTGKTFWPAIHRIELGEHPVHPNRSCLVATIPRVLPASQRQTQVDAIYQAAQEGTLLARNAATMESHEWVVAQPGELVLARQEDDSSGGVNDTVIGLALTSAHLDVIVPDSSEQLKVCLRNCWTQNGNAYIC